MVITYKYNLLTFLPLFLFNQFKRVANIYFLLISILQLIPGLSPTGQFTTLLVLIFVLLINAIKEVYEDYKRHRDDNIVNNLPVQALRDGVLVQMAWWQLQVGDIVKLQHKDNIPADLVLLTSSEDQGVVYVETSSLDGETNLKRKQAIAETQDALPNLEALAKWHGAVKAEHPHRFISSFTGNVSMEREGEWYPLDETQMLLRGSSVRNTKLCWAMVVYTGDDTKLVLNSKKPPFKRTLVERKTNRYIFAVFVLLLCVSIGCAIGSSVYINVLRNASYLELLTVNAASQGAVNFITFFILFGQMIPISLYTSMEIVRLFQAFFMQQDLSMYYAKNDVPMVARSTTLNEELGQVSMIFSDKTGTLTQNQMQFRKCVIGGVTYGRGYTEIGLANARRRGETIDVALISDDANLKDIFVNFTDERIAEQLAVEQSGGKEGPVTAFLTALALCHTIVPEKDDAGELEYQASSPDEMALVCAARQTGFFFHARQGRTMGVRIGDKEEAWELFNVLEFDSDRKRMSVIVRHQGTGRLALYCKGADSVILERLAPAQEAAKATESSLEVLGSEGLRTLMVARRDLDEQYYQQWSDRYDEASRLLEGRKEAQDVLSEEIEKELTLLGATAIEDKLQEGVPEAIATLARANLSIYVLTGDKQETAINIGFACSLLTESMTKMIVNAEMGPVQEGQKGKERDAFAAKSTEEQLDRYIAETEGALDGNDELAMIINGFSLRFALEEEFGLEDKFLKLSQRCKSIICCRVTPAQKAQVVTLAKNRLKKITLAIGDGANDVSMIQAAHVGVGISGEEGLQAVRSSDYAIGQFRFLVPLLLVHGRYSYRRMTKLIMYFFYKNVFLVMTQFWYAIFNAFTGQSLFEQWTLAIYNVVFTSIPIIIFAAVDEDVSRDTVLRNPQLYKDGQTNTLFTLSIFLRWVANGIYMSAAVFFMGYGTYQEDLMSQNGQDMGLWVFGYYVFTGLVVVVNLRLALEIKTWVWYMHLAVWASIVSWYLWGAIFAPVWPALKLGSEMYWVPYVAWAQPSYWLSVLLMCVVSLVVTFAWTFVQRTYFPQDYHIIQEQDIVAKHSLRIPEAQRPDSQMFAPNPRPAVYKGFAYSPGDEEGLRASIRQPRRSLAAVDGETDLDRQSSVIGLVKAEDQLLK